VVVGELDERLQARRVPFQLVRDRLHFVNPVRIDLSVNLEQQQLLLGGELSVSQASRRR
jgi:hypothetical protein